MRWPLSLLMFLAFTLTSLSASAFVLVPTAKPCMLFFRSDSVFTGLVTSEITHGQWIDGQDWITGWTYKLKILHAYRGVDTPNVEVYTGNDSGRLPLKVGRKYLLFADREGSRLVIVYDGVSGTLKDSALLVKDLERIMRRKGGQGGEVYGRVVEGMFSDTTGGVSSIRVVVRGEKTVASAVTDSNGWFHMHVPAGRYRAVSPNADWTFTSQDIAWQNAKDFTVPDGGCAEIQLQASEASSPVKP